MCPRYLICSTGTYFCADKSVPAVVIKGLAEHKRKYGSPLCPCRHYDDKAAEVAQGFWNCPCVPMRERHVGSVGCIKAARKRHAIPNEYAFGSALDALQECHCMLFLTPDNEFRGEDQTISREEIEDVARTEEP